MSNILVTGGAGYIGSHACKELKAAGYNPVSFDNMVYGHEWAVKWGPLVRGDINDTALLIKTLKDYDIKAVMHFAGFTYVGESVTNPQKYYNNNMQGSLSLLKAMNECGVDKIIFSSTCATFGAPQKIPMSEDHPQNPINSYGFSKFVMERMLADYHRAYGLRSISLRYFNAAGADKNAETGEVHDPETHIIPLCLDAALGLREKIVVFGTDYETPDGTCVRDYIHVSDLAQAHIIALKKIEKESCCKAYNLGTGKGHSVKEIIAACERVTGKKIPVQFGERRAGDPAFLVADNSLSLRELLWSPSISSIDEIVSSALRFKLTQTQHT